MVRCAGGEWCGVLVSHVHARHGGEIENQRNILFPLSFISLGVRWVSNENDTTKKKL